jgi:hypothetical protein
LPPALAVFEIIVLLVIPIGLERFVPAFPDLTTYNPHPYWGPILLLSLQYGTVSGLLAAIVAIAGTVLIGLPEPDIGENHFAYMVRVWTQPFLWITAALLIGHFRLRQIEQRDELARQVDDLANRSSALADYATNLRARCTKLERRVVGRQTAPGGDVLEAALALPSASPETLRSRFHRVVQLAFPGTAASLFLVSGDKVGLVASSGWPERDAPWRRDFTADDAPARVVVGEGQALSILVKGDEHALGGEGIFAFPIFGDDGRSVVGMLKIEKLASQLVTAKSERRFALIASELRRPLSLLAGQRLAAAAPRGDGERAEPSETGRRWRRMRWFTGGTDTAIAVDAPTATKTTSTAGR